MQIYVPRLSGGEPQLPRPPAMNWLGVILLAGVLWFVLWFASAPSLKITKEENQHGYAGRGILHAPKSNNVPNP